MDRRQFLVGSTTGVVSISGCATVDPLGTDERTKRNFSVQESPFVLELENRRENSTSVSIRISRGNDHRNQSLRLAAGQAESVTDPFPAHGEYDIRVSDGSVTTSQTINTSEQRREKLRYTIEPENITVQAERRPSIDVGISNHQTDNATIEISVEHLDSGSEYYDTVRVPGEKFRSYRDVFDRNGEYRVTITTGSKTTSENIYSSDTNALSISVSNSGLDVSVSEE